MRSYVNTIAIELGFSALPSKMCNNNKIMPEEIKTPAAGEEADKQPIAGENNQPGADKPGAADTGAKDAGAGEDKGGGADDPNKDPNNAKAPKEALPGTEPDDGLEPVTRKRLSKQDFIIGRQRAKLAKKQDNPDDDQGNEDIDDDNPVEPEYESAISKVVAKNFAPLIDKSIEADDNKEIGEFLTQNPDFKQYESKVRRYMSHPSRRQLPIKSIFYEVAGDNLMKIGADRERAAALKAKETQTGGGSNRGGNEAKSDFDLSKEEFEAKQERIRHGK